MIPFTSITIMQSIRIYNQRNHQTMEIAILQRLTTIFNSVFFLLFSLDKGLPSLLFYYIACVCIYVESIVSKSLFHDWQNYNVRMQIESLVAWFWECEFVILGLLFILIVLCVIGRIIYTTEPLRIRRSYKR